MTASIPGIYAAYLSGQEGHGLAMLLFSHGRIAGADAFGVTFDGSYVEAGDGRVGVNVAVASPPNMPLLQGGVTGQSGDCYTIEMTLPSDFATSDFVPIETKHGQINARLRKLRELNG